MLETFLWKMLKKECDGFDLLAFCRHETRFFGEREREREKREKMVGSGRTRSEGV